MKHFSQVGLLFLVITSLFWIGCGDEDSKIEVNDQFDRSSMINHWVDGFIVPGYKSYSEDIDSMHSKCTKFVIDPTAENLEELRKKFQSAYISWQEVSMFEIGKAEELTLRNQTNIYPTNTIRIIDNIESQNYNLSLPSSIDAQGLPAIEYLIYGVGDNDQQIIDLYISSDGYKDYLSTLTQKLNTLSSEVYLDWINGYRDTFIADDGSSASSSVNRLINDYLFYYERFLRAGKIAIPAGVFSGNPLPNNVEALYSNSSGSNKSLYLEAFSSFNNFFEGKSEYIGDGPSIAAYLDYIKDLTDGADVRNAIDNAIENVYTVSADLDDNLQNQVEQDNSKMLTTYDALQVITVLMKTDMLSTLNISVDYVDADGD